MNFKYAILRKPSKSLSGGLRSVDYGDPDYKLALLQHRAYILALQECGLEVTVLEPLEEYPDSVFIEDVALCTPGGAIICKPGAGSRRGEEIHVVNAIRKHFQQPGKIISPGTVEAGDIMMAGKHFYIGLSQRTNREGAEQMIAALEKYGFIGSCIPLKGILHLKTGISYLENNNILCWKEMSLLPEFSQYNKLVVPDNEKYAANSVWINGTVLVPRGNPVSERLIKEQGYNTIALDMSEFRKLDGGLSCLSLRF